MKTEHAKQHKMQPRWLLVDAKDQVLGRLASRVASILRGKENPMFTTHVDTGDFVVVVNAGEIRLTGKKWNDKIYYDYSGYPGGLRERTAAIMKKNHPTEMIRRAVRGMLPKGPLGYRMIRKLKIYAGSEHPHEAQKPEKIDMLKGRRNG